MSARRRAGGGGRAPGPGPEGRLGSPAGWRCRGRRRARCPEVGKGGPGRTRPGGAGGGLGPRDAAWARLVSTAPESPQVSAALCGAGGGAGRGVREPRGFKPGFWGEGTREVVEVNSCWGGILKVAEAGERRLGGRPGVRGPAALSAEMVSRALRAGAWLSLLWSVCSVG